MGSIGLDNPAFNGRVRNYSRQPGRNRRLIKRTVYQAANPAVYASEKPLVVKPYPAQVLRQQPVLQQPQVPQTPPLLAPPLSIRPKRSKAPATLVAMAIGLFIFGSVVAFLGLKTNTTVKVQAQSQSKASDSVNGSAPVEARPTNTALGSYTVAPDLPRYLLIEKLSVKARVRQLSVDSKNQLQAPSNIYDTGWYSGSSKPGDPGGAMLMDGHVAGPTQHGVFYGLKTLKPGDKIQVERGDGKVFSYSVVKSQSYDASNTDMSAAMQSAQVGKAGLNLMTCTGQFDSKSNEYKQRIIVFATAD